MEEQMYPTSMPGLQIAYAGRTDIGCRRKKNEDAMGFFQVDDFPRTQLLIVADGVGGAFAGEVAANIAVETIGRSLFHIMRTKSPAAAMRESFLVASQAILADAEQEIVHTGMATTCTAAAIQGNTIVVGHVGDTRAYLVRAGQLHLVTQDHIAGSVTRTANGARRQTATLTRCLGTPQPPEIEIRNITDVVPGTILILCSDGLNKVVKDEEILHAVAMHLPAKACEQLVGLALERECPDNVTVQVAAFVSSGVEK